MGACQNQFQNVPDLQINKSQTSNIDKERQRQRFSSNSIRLPHKTCKPNSKDIKIGMINSNIHSNYQRNTLSLPTNSFQETGMNRAHSLQEGIISQLQSNNSQDFEEDQRIAQINRQELHQTFRPFQDDQEIIIPQQSEKMIKYSDKQRKQLSLDFFHSLGLPQYTYPEIPNQYLHQYQDNLQMKQQQERNGVKYIGQWKDQHIHGNGILKSNTIKYIGQFRFGLKHFHGRQIQTDEVYQGQFQSGRRKGNGIRYTPQLTQQGEFNEYLIKGKITYSNGDIYEGQLFNKKYNGKGILKQVANGIVYQGNFKNGKMHGFGNISYEDGKQYKGEFYEGLKHGQGKFIWDDKNYYQGTYMKGKKHGRGILCRNGVYYQGLFSNGNMDGLINIYEKNGNKKIKERKEQYLNGMRIQQDSQSFLSSNDELPENWMRAVK